MTAASLAESAFCQTKPGYIMGGIMQEKKLPDTPWHLGYAHKDPVDPRRHKSRCIFNQGGTCKNGHNGGYLRKCPGSSHCKYYTETENNWADVWERTKTAAQEEAEENIEAWERAEQAQKNRIAQTQRLLDEDKKRFRYRTFDKTRRCPICDSLLAPGPKKKTKWCQYCHALYADESLPNIERANVFILKTAEQPKKKRQGTSVVFHRERAANNKDARKGKLSQ